MIKTILLSLFKTFIFSLVISIAICCIYYSAVEKGTDYGKAVPAIVSALFYLNGILLIMAVPALFLINPVIRTNPVWRLFLYFSGPLAFIITNFVVPKDGLNNAIYIIPGIVFLLIHAYFYTRLLKKTFGK